MTIGGISAVSGYSGIQGIYPIYNSSAVAGVRGADSVTRGSDGTAQATVDGAKDAEKTGKDGSSKRVSKEDCQTCKNRKYVDGSNDANVSFKTPSRVSPNSAAAAVMGHEQEHVANAIAEGNEPGKELVSATVTLRTSTCPECGSVYVSGGTTHSSIRSTSESSQPVNPYEKRQADLNYEMAAGANLDLTA
jgi:hypothetical protein